MNDISFRVYFVEASGEKYRTIQAGVESTQMVDIVIITQTIPTIAIAPLLVLWMGFGMAPKITLVVITTFFPISIGLLDGYRSADPDEVNLLRAMGANRLQVFWHIKLPSATGSFFSGLRISASYAVVGAVISEWLGGFEGLGVYMAPITVVQQNVCCHCVHLRHQPAADGTGGTGAAAGNALGKQRNNERKRIR